MIRQKLISIIFIGLGLFILRLEADEPEFFTDFEQTNTPAYVLGDLNGQNGWSMTDGTAEIQDTLAFSGLQSAQFQAGNASIGVLPMPTADSTGGISLSLRARVGPPDDQQASQPAELDFSGAKIRFDAENGLQIFDGSLDGGAGDWMTSGISIQSNRWFRVTFQVDHSTQSWNLLYQGNTVASGVGMASGNPGAPTFLQVQPGNQELFLDSLIRGAQPILVDDDDDELTNLEEELLFFTKIDDPDSDGDEIGDREEIQAGTDPNDPDSYLRPTGMVVVDGQIRISFPTVTDRLYTVEYSETLSPPDFHPVNNPAYVGMLGTGGVVEFEEPLPSGPVIYRVRVERL